MKSSIRKMLTAAGGPMKKIKTRDINGNWVYMDISTGRTTSAGPETGTIRTNTVNSVGGDIKTKQGRTKIALKQATSYNNRLYKVHNYADTTMRLKLKHQDVVLDKQGEPKIVLTDYTPALEAPMLIVSPEFDVLTLGRLAVTSLGKSALGKPSVDVMGDAATLKTLKALTSEEINKAFELAKNWHLNRINSEGYVNRALKAGFTQEEIPLLRQQLISLINRLDLISPESLFGKVNIRHNFNGKSTAGYWKAFKDGKLFQGIELTNPNISYDDAVSTFVHEFGHGATFGLRGDETTGYMKLLADLFPLINRAVKYNKTLYPEINESIIAKKFPKLPDPKYYANPTEILSRGYEFMRDYANNFFKLKKSPENFTTQDVINNAANSRINSLIFRALTGNLGAFNFLKYALGTIPVGVGYNLSNNDLNNLQPQYQKQGGKMNTLEYIKNGSGIHIKKKNRGKFTDYCGGKVTDACIRKAKASGNPTLVKRATFADNARHFKHRSGGLIIQEFKLRKIKIHGKLGFDAFNIIKTNPEGLPYKLGQKWELMYNFKKGGIIKSANARKWKHAKGGILYGSEGIDLGYDMNQGMDVGMDYGMDPDLKKNKKATAPVDSKGGLKEAYDWFKLRYSNVNWNNMNYIYNQFKRAGIPYDTAIAVMGNIVHESQGDPRRRQVGGGPGYGLLQWNKGTEPGDTLVTQTRGIISALKNPASLSNYWYHGGAGSGFRTGADAQKYIMSKNNYNFTNKTKVFSSSYLRPGKPHLEDRIKSSRLLARLYKEYNKGGIL